MNYANLIQNITENIKTNGSQAITAQVLQEVLVDMVGELGQSGALLGGVIDTSFVPDSTNDAQVVYIAEAPGTYTNFNGLVVGAGEVAFFYFDGNAWAKSSVDVLEVVNSLNSTATDKALSAAMGKQLQDSLTQAVNDLTTAIGNKADRQTTEQALNTLQNQINDKADTTYVNSQLATKADTATVNAALANKADTSYVNTQLATKADATATSTALAGKADKVAGAVAGNMASLDAIGGIEDSGVAADNIAEQDGYYETMVVGGAENLIGNDIVSSQFIRRKTGGSTDVGTGVAILKTIKGNTLVWNQLMPGTQTLAGFQGSCALSGGVYTLTGSNNSSAYYMAYSDNIQTWVAGHKYYVSCVVDSMTLTPQFYFFLSGAYGAGRFTTTGKHSDIISVTTAATRFAIYAAKTANTDGASMSFEKVQIIDLTAMGLDSLTAEQFEALYPLNYYDYNAGSLLSLTATGLQTNGFNQWDEEWELGSINSDGTAQTYNSAIRSKYADPIKCLPSTTYYAKSPNDLRVYFYDAGGTFISRTPSTFHNNIFITPAGCYLMRLAIVSAYGTTYNHDICINLSDVNKNGTYEPYWSETKALPITTATSGGVAIFSDGMKSAGTAYDEMTATKATKRIGAVDLGTLSWTALDASIGVFRIGISTKRVPYTGSVGNLTCTGYVANSGAYVPSSSMTERMIQENISNPTWVLFKNSSWNGYTATQVQSAMSGVYLYYELATPTEYTLDTPFNGQYRVDNDGTETIMPENTSTPTTSPIVADINYALNAIDTIRNLPQNYISKASMDAILTAFKTAGVITNYTLTWDATNQKYNCTITA